MAAQKRIGMLGSKHFFLGLDHIIILHFRLGVLAFFIQHEGQVHEAHQRKAMLGPKHFFPKLDHITILRFRLGILALQIESDG